MKIKYKKKTSETSYIKLIVKVDDYPLLDKMDKNELKEIIDLLKSLTEDNKKC